MLSRLFCSVLIPACPLSAADFTREIRPLLETHCFDCHGDEAEPEGGANLERFRTWSDVISDRQAWAAVREKMESGQMPPPRKKSQPAPAERAQILAWIDELAAAPDPELKAADPGKPVLRRLTRLEYNNSIRDLFRLRTDVFMFPERLPVGRSYFPDGLRADHVTIPVREYGTKYAVLLPAAGLPGGNRAEHGYANRGEAMNLSPLLFENYLAMARAIVHSPKLPHQSDAFRQLIHDPALPPEEAANSADAAAGFSWTAVPAFAPNLDLPQQAVRGGAVTVTYQFRFNAQSSWEDGMGGVWDATFHPGVKSETIPAGEEFRVRYGPDDRKQLVLTSPQSLWVAGFSTAEEVSGESLFTNAVKMEKVIDVSLAVRSGLRGEAVTDLALCVLSREKEKGTVGITAQFSGGTSRTLEHDIIPGSGAGNTFYAFRAPDGEYITGFRVDGSKFSGNHVLLDDLGFLTAAGLAPVAEQKPVRMSAAQKRKHAEDGLAGFLFHAFRHPVDKQTVARYLDIYDAAPDYPSGMKEALAAALASPEFLYLTGPGVGGADGVRPLDPWELASRLSYFLWSAPPDARLITAAGDGSLARNLDAEVTRMLRDPKAKELSESFAVQWLRLDQLYTARPDPDKFKGFYFGDRGKLTMHSSFLVEGLLLFEDVLAADRSVLDFIDPGYTWLNLRMGRHYGLSDIVMPRAKELKLEINSRNELKDARANSVWMRTKIPDKRRGGYLTMAGPLTVTSLPLRTSPVKRGAWLLETIFNRPPQEPKIAFVLKEDDHREAETASVRQRFEAHRTRSECYSCHVRLDPPGFALEAFDPVGSWRTTDAGQAVDAKSEWNGVAFDGPAEFKARLMADPEEFVRGFTEHLLSYALGRKLELYDRPAVDAILTEARRDGWKMQTIIRGIVRSWPFLNSRTH